MKNNKFFKILGIILSLSMICSVMVIPMTVQAETTWQTVWTQNFDNLTPTSDGTYNLGGASTDALEVDPTGYATPDKYDDVTGNKRHAYLTADTKTGTGYALALTHTPSSTASIPVNTTFDGKSTYKITYDWLTNAPNESGKKSRVRFYQESGDHYQVTKSEGKPYLTTYGWGTTSEVPPIGEWVKGEITLNSATKDVTVKWIKSDGTIILNKTGSQWTNFTDISKIELVGEIGGQMIDNIVIEKEATEEVEDDDEYTTVWTQNFDNLTPTSDGTYNLGGASTDALEVDPTGYATPDKYDDVTGNKRHAYLTADTKTGTGYALALTHTPSSTASIPVNTTFDGKSTYKITYDWLTNAPNESGKKSRVRFYQESGDHYQVTKSEGKPYLTTYGWGTTSEVPPIGEWVKGEITFNSATKDVTVKWIKSDGTVILNKTGSQWTNFTDISKIELVGEIGGQMIDNIVISKMAGEEPDVPEEPVELPENTVYAQLFDGDYITANGDGTYTLGGENTTALEVNPVKVGTDEGVTGNSRHAYYSTNGAGYALTLTHTGWSSADFPISGATIPETEGKGVYKITYDWQTNCTTTDYSYVRFTGNGGYVDIGVNARKPYIAGTTGTTDINLNTWYKVEVVFDYGNSTIDYTIYDGNGDVFFELDEPISTTLTSLTKIGLIAVAGGQKIDNIIITCENDGSEVIELPENTVWSQNFNDTPASLGGENATELNKDSSSRHAFYTSNGKGYALEITHTGWSGAGMLIEGVTVPKFAGRGVYKLTYDWSTNCATTDGRYSYIRLKNGNSNIAEIGAKSRNPYVNGTTDTTKEFNVKTWYKVEVTLDFDKKEIDTIFYDNEGNEFARIENVSAEGLTGLTQIWFEGIEGGMIVDNIVLTCEDDGAEVIELPENTVWSQNFNAAATDLGGENTTALEVNPAKVGTDSGVTGSSRHAYYSTNGAGYALTLTHTGWSSADFPISGATIPETEGKGVYKITYDWQTNCTTTDYSYVRFTGNGGYVDIGVNARKPYIAGIIGTTDINLNTWYKVEVVFDYGNSTIDYTIYDRNGDVFFVLEEPVSTSLTSLTKIGLIAVAGGEKIDNIIITYEGESPEAHEHSWDEGVITLQPTVDAEGVMTYTCTGCGEQKTEAIEKLPAPSYKAGDANGDSAVDVKDVIMIRRYITGGYGVTFGDAAADVNEDGLVDVKDVIAIRRYITGGYGVELK